MTGMTAMVTVVITPQSLKFTKLWHVHTKLVGGLAHLLHDPKPRLPHPLQVFKGWAGGQNAL